jgi:hypothetical protein
MRVLLILLLFFIGNVIIGAIPRCNFFLIADIALRNRAVVAVVTITTGQGIGFAYRTLVMAMQKNQINIAAAEKAIHFHGLFFKQ